MEFSDVERLAAGGESERVELKLSTGQRRDAARTLSAMLNGRGGSVLFGVCRDRRVVGQDVADRTLENITATCRETIYPTYPPAIERMPVLTGAAARGWWPPCPPGT